MREKREKARERGDPASSERAGARGGAGRQRRTMAGAAPAAEQPRTRAAANQPQAAIGPAARRWTAGAQAGEDDGLAGSSVARTAQRGGVDQRRLQIWRELARLRGGDGDQRRRRVGDGSDAGKQLRRRDSDDAIKRFGSAAMGASAATRRYAVGRRPAVAVVVDAAGEQRRPAAEQRRRRGSDTDSAVARCRPVGCAISTKSRRRDGGEIYFTKFCCDVKDFNKLDLKCLNGHQGLRSRVSGAQIETRATF
ncbi:hypothetical protein Scep_014732 [Stephania cephalantha]|uniref:Uncharacterized protein n=1 Tax=Stephania cephalantha TaxID=152367 RepID=A0AAP0J1Q8_9MAGN